MDTKKKGPLSPNISFTLLNNVHFRYLTTEEQLPLKCKTHHHYDDHGARKHAREPGLLWKIGLFDTSYWILLHGGGHGCKFWPRTLLGEDMRLDRYSLFKISCKLQARNSKSMTLAPQC